MVAIAYAACVLVALFCIVLVIIEHKKCKQKNIDIELYNQGLEVQKTWLEQQNNELVQRYQNGQEEIQLIHKQTEQLSEQQKELTKKIGALKDEKTRLDAQVHTDCTIIENMRREYDHLTAQMDTLNSTIETTTRNQQSLARQAFVSYCDALDTEYTQKEKEYEELIAHLGDVFESEHNTFLSKVSERNAAFARETEQLSRDIDLVRSELERIRATRAAAMEAQLREEEIKNQATFYTLQLDEADMRDVSYLRSIEYNLREPRPLRMLIWSTFYRDKVNELAARVGAIGACGIYKITHIESGISYIGQARDIKERWISHVKCSLGIDTPATSKLYAFTREKGIDNFTFEILEKCSMAELNEKEKFYIDLYQTYEFGLNATKGNK